MDNLGNKLEYAYDLKGNRTREDTRDPDGTMVRSIQSTYDLRDRLQSIDAAGSITQTLRDAVGKPPGRNRSQYKSWYYPQL